MAAIPHSNEKPSRQAMRLAVGVAIGFSVAQFAGWPIAHVLPVFVVVLLADPEPLSIRAGTRVFLTNVFFIAFGMVVATLLYPWPAVLVLSMGFLLYHLYRYLLLSGAELLCLVSAILGLVIVPVVVVLLPPLALIAGQGLLLDFGFAILIAWIAWLILPQTSPAPASHLDDLPTAEEASEMAITLTFVMMPIMLVFMCFGVTKVLVLVYTALWATTGYSSTAGQEEGKTSMIANGVYGGIGMLVVYELFVIMPSAGFMVVVIFAVTLIYGTQIFRHTSSSGYWLSGFVGFLIMLGGVLMKDDVVATGTLLDRLWQLFMATAYVVFAFSVVEMFRSWRTDPRTSE